MSKNPNPQGKGQVVLLRDLESLKESIDIRPKNLKEVSSELFTALFVLHSDCKFSAIPGNTYYLYRLNGRYQMMMIGPNEWFAGAPGSYWGRCHLQLDLCWSLELSEEALNDLEFQTSLELAQKDFQTKLESSDSLEDALPFHLQDMPYHQRVLAFGLAKSLNASMELKGYAHLSYAEASKELSD